MRLVQATSALVLSFRFGTVLAGCRHPKQCAGGFRKIIAEIFAGPLREEHENVRPRIGSSKTVESYSCGSQEQSCAISPESPQASPNSQSTAILNCCLA